MNERKVMEGVGDLAAAANEVKNAIENAGPHEQYHWALMNRHSEEWPTLWEAIAKLIVALRKIEKGSK
jgi:hypothetical protein